MIHPFCPTVLSLECVNPIMCPALPCRVSRTTSVLPHCVVTRMCQPNHVPCPALQSFKDHLRLPLAGIAASARSYGDSDAASSLRSGPGGKPSSLWSFLRGPGRCAPPLLIVLYSVMPTCAAEAYWIQVADCVLSACAVCVPGCQTWV
jgi:hypothetical protein